MLILREVPRRVEGKSRRASTTLTTLESSFPFHGREHKLCHELAFMVLGRVNHHLPACEELEDCTFHRAVFSGLLKVPAIEGLVWHHTDKIVCSLVSNLQEAMGPPPLEFRFRTRPRNSIEMTLWDTRVVDRKAACRQVTTLMLSKDVVVYSFIQKDVLMIIARMVWATRLNDYWAPRVSTVTPDKRRKTTSSAKYTDYDMPDEAQWDHEYSLSGDDEDKDDDDDDDDPDSFSLHSENSEDEDDSD